MTGDFSLKEVNPTGVEIIITSSEPLRELLRFRLTQVDLSVGREHHGPHDTRLVAAQLLFVAEIQKRLGLLLEEMLEASRNGFDSLPNTNFFFDADSGRIGVSPSRVLDLFDPNKYVADVKFLLFES